MPPSGLWCRGGLLLSQAGVPKRRRWGWTHRTRTGTKGTGTGYYYNQAREWGAGGAGALGFWVSASPQRKKMKVLEPMFSQMLHSYGAQGDAEGANDDTDVSVAGPVALSARCIDK